jgi:5-dehydro-2-deoxygluconokinase
MLYILPFDHRGSFMKLINAARPPTKKDIRKVKDFKKIIYAAFIKSIKKVPKKHTAILVDEQFGKGILKDAKKKKITLCNTFEKSGQKEFQFERKDWKKQLTEIKPDYAKILIRYNPKNKKLNLRQAEKLLLFSNYLKNRKTKFLLEIITPNQTREERSSSVSWKHKESKAFRCPENSLNFQGSKSILQAIKQLQKKGVEPDVWKLEGVDKIKDMKKISKQIKSQIVILGRGENKKKAEHWLEVAAKFNNVIGFAIGRTIFAQPLKDYNNKKLTRKQTINKISKSYINFVEFFEYAKEGRK